MTSREFDPGVVQSYAKGASSHKPKVAYFYDPDIGSYYYGPGEFIEPNQSKSPIPGHPMKPQRMRMTHSLILAYDLYKHMEVNSESGKSFICFQVYRPHDAEHTELVAFHDAEYVNFLSEITVDNHKVRYPRE